MKLSFRLKTVLGLLLIQGVISLSLIWYSIHKLDESANEALTKRATTTTQLIAAMSKDAFLSYDLATLNTYIEEILLQPDVIYIRILNDQGLVFTEGGSIPAVNTPIVTDKHLPIVDDGVFDSMATIEDNGIHYGTIELGLDISFVDRQASEIRRSFMLILSLSIVSLTILATLFGSYLTRQLASLVVAAKALSDGDFSHRIKIKGNDEISGVATNFNRMAAKLDQLYNDLRQEIALNQAIFDTSPSGIILTDTSSRINRFNLKAEQIFGYQADEVINHPVSILFVEEDQDEALKTLQCTEFNGQHRKEEIRGCRKNLSQFPVELSAAPLIGSSQLFLGMYSDITERKANEASLRNYRNNLEHLVEQRTEQLEQAKDDAEAGARTKAAFIANMSHEIRTPMNSIIGFAEILLMHDLDEAPRKQVMTILESAKSLLSIINDILDISKLESGKFSLETIPFHLHNTLIQAFGMLEQQAAEKRLAFELNIDPDVPVRVIGDPTRLRQVVLNLLGNAIKFTEEGSVSLSISPLDEEGNLLFSVADTGIGMTPEQAGSIFEAFVQADDSTTRQFGGTGLGTTICRQIVGLMQGDIWVESKVGKGSYFYFTCHFESADDDAECINERIDLLEDGYRSPRRFNILLAEDIETNAELAMLRLSQQGHEITWVRDGSEAVEAFRHNSYDIILMDVMMPMMDGLDATRRIRQLENEDNSYTPILALTASVMREDHERCRAAGMDAVEAKPIQFDRLLTALENWVPETRGIRSPFKNRNLVQYKIDFSPVEAVLAKDDAINAWQDEKALCKALIRFGKQHKDTALNIGQALTSSPDSVLNAKGIAHTLKGLAGNLHLKEVYDLSVRLDDCLKQEDRAGAEKLLPLLQISLEKAAQATAQLVIPAETHTCHPCDPEQLLKHFQLLLEALQQHSPDKAEPAIEEIAAHISRQDLTRIEKALELFDFSTALSEAKTLAVHLKLPIGESVKHEENTNSR